MSRPIAPGWARLALVIAFLGLAFRLPEVASGFFFDDLGQLAFLSDTGQNPYSFRNGLDLFRFLDGDAEAARAKMSAGALPWRLDDTTKAAFFRPLSSALMALDHALFGVRTLPAHIHSFLWFLVFLLGVRRIYCYVLTKRAADIATLAAVLSPASILMVEWWADRYALLVAVFAAWGLFFHIRWQREGRRRDMLLSLLCLAASMLSGELAVQGLAFVWIYAIVRARGAVGASLRHLAPSVLLFVAYWLIRGFLGYGTEHNAFYIDPVGELPEYVASVTSRFHVVLAAALLNEQHWVLMLAAGSALVALLVRTIVRERGEAALWVWLPVASILALAPCFAARDWIRPWTLVIPQIGMHAILGMLVASAWTRAAWRPVVIFLCAVWLIAPVRAHWRTLKAAPNGGTQFRGSNREFGRFFPPETREAITEGITKLIFLRSPSKLMPVSYLTLWGGVGGLNESLTTLVLSDTGVAPQAEGQCVLVRLDPSTLRMTSSAPLIMAGDFYRFDQRTPFQEDQTVSLDDVAITIEDMEGDRVTSIRFAFSTPLDGEGVLLLTWARNHFEVVPMPPVGATVGLK